MLTSPCLILRGTSSGASSFVSICSRRNAVGSPFAPILLQVSLEIQDIILIEMGSYFIAEGFNIPEGKNTSGHLNKKRIELICVIPAVMVPGRYLKPETAGAYRHGDATLYHLLLITCANFYISDSKFLVQCIVN